MAKLWQSAGDICSHVNQSFGHVMARIWQSYDRAMAKFGKVMVKLWQRYGKVYGKAMAELWQGDSEVMVKLILAPVRNSMTTFVPPAMGMWPVTWQQGK